ncbi:hypothetical protein [Clostridium gasigenes]|uniref:hypothetical protein n=1 Tax=Clostridium gasigenes TaxID=94869 RepID=UPI001C0CAF9C|nr:hypothetical protein [Clostridium gasigenes]MBU3106599.1 hypothetical protein [Clostridium gasigenes]
MHIKIGKRINNKKRGYVLLEAVVILMVVACICMLLNKIVINNYLKSSVIHTRDDIKTLSGFEEYHLLEAEKEFSTDKTKNKYIRKNPSLEIKKVIININGTSGTLIKQDINGNHDHVELECKKNIVDGKELVKLVPKFYRTDYIPNCKCGLEKDA